MLQLVTAVAAVIDVVAGSDVEIGPPSHRSEITTLAENNFLPGLPGRQGVVRGSD